MAATDAILRTAATPISSSTVEPPRPVLRGMVWYQGESDTTCESDALVYGERFSALIDNVRAELGRPGLPVCQCAITVIRANCKYVKELRRQQLDFKKDNVFTIDAAGLPLLPDQLHLKAKGSRELGDVL